MSSTAPYLSAITLYPVKALDGVSVDACRVLPSGGLEHDRSLAILDCSGNFVNGKREAAIHRLRAAFDLAARTITLNAGTLTPGPLASATFHLDDSPRELEAWLSSYFGYTVRVQRNSDFGFPDDTESPGPTIVCTASLETVADWFPDQSLAETRRRFRANLEIAVPEPFWEDQLVGPPGSTVLFQIGDVSLFGTNPCQRCVVPTRSSSTGEATPGFSKIFSERRQRDLPGWSPLASYDHFYRLAVNTRLASLGSGWLHVGDPVRVVSS